MEINPDVFNDFKNPSSPLSFVTRLSRRCKRHRRQRGAVWMLPTGLGVKTDWSPSASLAGVGLRLSCDTAATITMVVAAVSQSQSLSACLEEKLLRFYTRDGPNTEEPVVTEGKVKH